MAHLEGKARADYVQDMFDRIAGRYNLMNRLMTGGQDLRWRRFVVQQTQLPPGGKLLDLATGTGDIGFEMLRRDPSAYVIGADFSLEMMQVGRHLAAGAAMDWAGADALKLPFSDASFDAVTSGYLMRNVIDINRSLSEQLRVLKTGGRIVILDSSPPPPSLLRPFINIHLRYVIPALGRLVVGKSGADAYEYLPQSTQAFKTPEDLAQLMRGAGIVNVQYRTFAFGTMAVHWGEKA
jgi:demethylmenaquinone methyltransferase/2-methoxy-6-polyprenyl-1,4-benzoquinol methylase